MDAHGATALEALRHSDEGLWQRMTKTTAAASLAVLAFLGSRAGSNAPLWLLLLDKLLSIMQFSLAFPLAAGAWAWSTAGGSGYFSSVSLVVNLSTLQPSILTDLIPGQASYFASIAVLLATLFLATAVGVGALLRVRSEAIETTFTFMAAGVTGVGFVPLMGGLLSVLDCGAGTPALGAVDTKAGHKWRGSSWACGSAPHVTAIAFGIVFAAALLTLGTLYVLLVVDRRLVLSAAAQSMQRQRDGAGGSSHGQSVGGGSGLRGGGVHHLAHAGGGSSGGFYDADKLFGGFGAAGGSRLGGGGDGVDPSSGGGFSFIAANGSSAGEGGGGRLSDGGFGGDSGSGVGGMRRGGALVSSAAPGGASTLTAGFVSFLQRAGAALSSASLGSFHAVPWPASSSSMSFTATSTGRVLALELWCRFLLVLFFVFKDRLPTIILALLCAAVALILYVAHAGTMPYNYMIINSVYCGACFVCVWASLMAVLSDSLPMPAFAGTVFLFGLPLTFFAGLSLFARRRRQYILNALELATSPVTTLPSSGAGVLDAHARTALFYASWAGTSALMQSITPALLSVARAGLGVASGSVGLRRTGGVEGGLGDEDGMLGRGGGAAKSGLSGMAGAMVGGMTPGGTRMGGTAAARANAVASVIALSTERVIDPLAAAEAVFTRALQDLPPSPLLHFNYAMFLLHAKGNRLLALAHLDRADALGAPLDLRYAIRQVWTAQELIPPHPVDRTVFQRITFEQQHAVAQQLTYVARVRLAEVWRLAGEKEPDPKELVDAARRFDVAARRTQEAFQELLDIQPDNVSALRDFADFLVAVVNDEPRAAELLEKAEKAEDLLSRRQHRGHGHPLLYLSPTDPLELTTDAAAFTLTMEGCISSVNSTALRIFRTARREMIGKPFASLLPPLLDVMFMSRLVNVLQAGEAAQPLGPRAGFFQRSDGTMFPVKAHVGYIGRRLAALIEPVVSSESFFIVTPPPRITEALRSMSTSGNMAALSAAAAGAGSGWTMASCDLATLTLLGVAQDDVASSSVHVERYMPSIGRVALEALAKFFGARPQAVSAHAAAAVAASQAEGVAGGASMRRQHARFEKGATTAVPAAAAAAVGDSSSSTPRLPKGVPSSSNLSAAGAHHHAGLASSSSFHGTNNNPFNAGGAAGGGARHAGSVIGGGASVRGGNDGATIISEDASAVNAFMLGATRAGGSHGALSRTHVTEVINIEVDRVVDGGEEGGAPRAGASKAYGAAADPSSRTFVALRLYFYADPDTPNIPGIWFASWRRTSPPAHLLGGRGGSSFSGAPTRHGVAATPAAARAGSGASGSRLAPAAEGGSSGSEGSANDAYSLVGAGNMSEAEGGAAAAPSAPAASLPLPPKKGSSPRSSAAPQSQQKPAEGAVIMELVPASGAPDTPPAATPASGSVFASPRSNRKGITMPPTATGSDNDDLVALLMDVASDAEEAAAAAAGMAALAPKDSGDAHAATTTATPKPPAGPPPAHRRTSVDSTGSGGVVVSPAAPKAKREASPHPRRLSASSLPERAPSPSVAAATPRTPGGALPQPSRNRLSRRTSDGGAAPTSPAFTPAPTPGAGLELAEPLGSPDPAAATASSRVKGLPTKGDWGRDEEGGQTSRSGNGGNNNGPRSEASSQTSRMTATDMLRRQIDLRRKTLDPALASLQRVFFLIFIAVVGCNIAALVATYTLTDGARSNLDRLQASAQRGLLLQSSTTAAHALALLASGASNAEWVGTPFSSVASTTVQRTYTAATARGVNATTTLPPLETDASSFGALEAWTYLGLLPSDTAPVASSLAAAAPVPLAPLLNNTAGLRLTAAVNATAGRLRDMVAALDDLQQALYSAAKASGDAYDTSSVRVIGRPGQIEDKIRVVTVVDAVTEVIAAARALVNRALTTPYAAMVPSAPLMTATPPLLADPALVYLLKNAPTTIAAAANTTTSAEAASAEDSLDQTRVIQPFITLSLALVADVLLIAVLVPLARRMQNAVQVVLETLLLVPTRVTRSMQIKAQLSAERVLAAVIQESDLLIDGRGVGAGLDLAGEVLVDVDGQLAVVPDDGFEGGEEPGEDEPFNPAATGGATAGGRGTRGPGMWTPANTKGGVMVGTPGGPVTPVRPGGGVRGGPVEFTSPSLGGVYGGMPSSNSLSLSMRSTNAKESNKPRHLRETSRAYCSMLLGFSTPLWMVLAYLLMSYLVISSLLSLSLKAPRQAELAYRRATLTAQYDQLVRTASQLPADPSPEAGLVLNVTLSAIDAVASELDTVNQLILFGDESVLLPSSMKTLDDQNALFLADGCAMYATTPTAVAGALLSVNEPLAAAGILPETGTIAKHSAACVAFDKGVFAYGMRAGLDAFVQAGRDLVTASLAGRANATAANLTTAATCSAFPRPLLVALYTYADALRASSIQAVQSYGVSTASAGGDSMAGMGSSAGGSSAVVGYQADPFAGLGSVRLLAEAGRELAATTAASSPACPLTTPASSSSPSLNDWLAPLASARQHLATFASTYVMHAMVYSAGSFAVSASSAIDLVRAFYLAATILSSIVFLVFWLGIYRSAMTRHNRLLYQVRSLLLLVPSEVTKAHPAIAAAQLRIANQVQSGQWLNIADSTGASDSDGEHMEGMDKRSRFMSVAHIPIGSSGRSSSRRSAHGGSSSGGENASPRPGGSSRRNGGGPGSGARGPAGATPSGILRKPAPSVPPVSFALLPGTEGVNPRRAPSPVQGAPASEP